MESTADPSFLLQLFASVGYFVSAVALLLLNKAVILHYPFTLFVVFLQCVVTVLLNLGVIWYQTASKDTKPKWLSKSELVQFLPIVAFFLLILVSGLEVFKYVSVVTFVALRYLGCLTTYLGDVVFLRRPFEWQVLPSLIIIIIGGGVYWANDMSFHLLGYLLIAVNVLSHSAFSVYTKYVDTQKNYGSFVMSLYNNGLSCFVLFIACFISSELPQTALTALPKLSSGDHVVLFFSCIVGWAMSVSGFLATSLFSATAWTIQGLLNKIPAMVLSIFLFDSEVSLGMWIGASITLLGGLFYPLTIMHLDEKRKTQGYEKLSNKDPDENTEHSNKVN